MKTIALAVAALVSGAAFAQSNVTLYGRADIGYTYSKSDYKKFSGIEQSQGYGGGGSHLGVRGEEALGNGLKAVFRFETAVTADETGNWESARYSYVGLAGKFGVLTLGKDQTPADRFVGATSVMGFNGYTPINKFRGLLGDAVAGTRWGNSIAYISPNFSGFDFAAIYSFGEKVSTDKDNNGRCNRVAGSGPTPVYGTTGDPDYDPVSVDSDTNPTGYLNNGTTATYSKCADTSDASRFGLGIRYANGPLYLTAVYQARLDDDSVRQYGTTGWAGGNGTGSKGWSLGGTYDFKVVKLHANYLRVKANHNGVVSGLADVGSDKQAAWSLGLSIPVSSVGTVMTEYAQYKDYIDNRVNPGALIDGHEAGHKAKGYTVGYRHNLSKRTWLYTYVSRIDNDRGINASADANKLRTPLAGEKQTNFTAGIVHLF